MRLTHEVLRMNVTNQPGGADFRQDALAGNDALVIGSGLGALTCALELARQGLRVCVLEQHRKAGGYAHGFGRKGFHFESSLRFLGGMAPGGALHGVLQSLGVLEKVQLVRHERLFSAEFPGGRSIELPNERQALLEQLCQLFPDQADGLSSLFAFMPQLRSDVLAPVLQPDFDASAAGRLSLRHVDHSFEDLVRQHINDPALMALLGQHWMSLGLPPSLASANPAACQFVSNWLEGIFHVVGGGRALVRAMVERLRELEGECLTGMPVRRILVERGATKGIELDDGRRVLAPLVISGADPYQTFFELIPGDDVSKLYRFRLKRLEPSLSLYSLCLGLDCSPDTLGIPRGVFYFNHLLESDEAYRRVMEGEIRHTDWSACNLQGLADYMHPPGCGVVQLLEAAPAEGWFELDERAYARRKAQVRERLLGKYEARFPGLTRHAVVHEFATPRTWTWVTRNSRGAVYGFAQNAAQSNRKRLMNRAPVGGVYLAGAWTRGGGGYEGAMLSGLQTAAAIMAGPGRSYRAPRVRLYPTVGAPEPSAPARAHPHSLPPGSPEEVDSEHYRFSFQLRVYGDDMNSRGKADASSLLRYLDRGRVEAIEQICGEAGQQSWLKSYVVNVYRIEARCATIVGLDDLLEVRTGLRKVTSHRAAFDQRIVNVATGDLVVDAVVEVLFLDLDMNLVPLPDIVEPCSCKLPDFAADRSAPQPFSDENRFPFRTRFRVYYEDTDAQQITYHVSYVRFCERALFDMVRSIWPDMTTNTWVSRNRVAVSRTAIRYLKSSTLGDRLEVWTGLLSLSSHKISFGQRILLQDSATVLADATTEVEFRDENEVPVPLPKAVADAGLAHLAGPRRE